MHKNTFLTHFLLCPQKASTCRPLKDYPYKKAAVLIALVQRTNGLHIILTKRALHLRLHSGQVCFPGGKYETADKSLQITALRETFEEIGIKHNEIQILGQLNKTYTLSGFEISPFIALVNNNYTLHIDAQEVESVFELPLAFLLNANNLYSYAFIRYKKPYLSYCLHYQDKFIWGATAQILKTYNNIY